MENIVITLRELAPVLKMTRAGSDIVYIDVTADGKCALIALKHGRAKLVNIACDSAIAAIIDVCKALL